MTTLLEHLTRGVGETIDIKARSLAERYFAHKVSLDEVYHEIESFGARGIFPVEELKERFAQAWREVGEEYAPPSVR